MMDTIDETRLQQTHQEQPTEPERDAGARSDGIYRDAETLQAIRASNRQLHDALSSAWACDKSCASHTATLNLGDMPLPLPFQRHIERRFDSDWELDLSDVSTTAGSSGHNSEHVSEGTSNPIQLVGSETEPSKESNQEHNEQAHPTSAKNCRRHGYGHTDSRTQDKVRFFAQTLGDADSRIRANSARWREDFQQRNRVPPLRVEDATGIANEDDSSTKHQFNTTSGTSELDTYLASDHTTQHLKRDFYDILERHSRRRIDPTTSAMKVSAEQLGVPTDKINSLSHDDRREVTQDMEYASQEYGAWFHPYGRDTQNQHMLPEDNSQTDNRAILEQQSPSQQLERQGSFSTLPYWNDIATLDKLLGINETETEQYFDPDSWAWGPSQEGSHFSDIRKASDQRRLYKGMFQEQTLDDFDNDDDCHSVASMVESIFSKASFVSSATDLSKASGYSAAQIKTATKELLQIFVEDDILVPLYRIAIVHPDIGTTRLQRNIRRLLKIFASNLQKEADRELEKLAARLVSARSSYVAQSIIEKFEVNLSRSHPTPCNQVTEECSEDETEEHEERDVHSDLVDEDLFQDLVAFKHFLTRGNAFIYFQRQLTDFVHQKPTVLPTRLSEVVTKQNTPGEEVGAGWEQDEEAACQQRHVHTSRPQTLQMLTRLFVAAGRLEPPLSQGWVRLRWQCKCGESFFEDVKEYRAGGVRDLIAKMSRSTGAKVTTTPYSKATTNQNWSCRAPAWTKRFTPGLSFSRQSRSANSTRCLPRHNGPDQSASPTTSAPAKNATTPNASSLHLLACAHQTQRRKYLVQDPIDSISTDQELFCFMRKQLTRSYSRIRGILSMRSVQGMFFIKFRLRMGNTVEVRDHDPCCTSCQPSSCACIPPACMVEPSPNAEYRCDPAGPLATWPPVLSKDLMHMLSSPQCINEQETWVLEQLPKRTIGPLQERVGQPVEGWGIYYQEGLDFDTIIGVVFVIFILASLLFGILWSVLKMDVQGAFGISSYMVTASGILVAWVASRAKNFG